MLRSCVRTVSASGVVEGIGAEHIELRVRSRGSGSPPFPRWTDPPRPYAVLAHNSTSRTSSSGPTRLGERGSTDPPAAPACGELCLQGMRASDDAHLELSPPPAVPAPAPCGGPVRRGAGGLHIRRDRRERRRLGGGGSAAAGRGRLVRRRSPLDAAGRPQRDRGGVGGGGAARSRCAGAGGVAVASLARARRPR
jgi:hypothetical protein